MKITWFAGRTVRLHIAGRIAVFDPAGAPEDIDLSEVLSGADTTISPQADALPAFEPSRWKPRKRSRLIDTEEGIEGLSLHRLGEDGLVADSLDEGLLVLACSVSPIPWNRWADGAVVVLIGSGAHCAGGGTALLEIARPRLVALAVTDGRTQVAFETLAPLVGDTSLTVLEPGLAVEV